MKIRCRQTDDLDMVFELDRECFPNDSALSGSEFWDGVWWLAERRLDGGAWEPVGFAGLYPQMADKKASLTRAGVLKEARGLHIQRRLIRVRVAEARRLGAKRVYTYVAAANIPSARSLARCGFLPYYLERTPTALDGLTLTFVYYEKHLLTK